MIPSAIVFVDQFPLTNNGKVDRKALPKPEVAIGTAAARTTSRRRATTEHMLGQIWARVLESRASGATKTTSSLVAIRSSAFRSCPRRGGLGSELTPRDLFEHRTIRQLAVLAAPRGERRSAGRGHRGSGATDADPAMVFRTRLAQSASLDTGVSLQPRARWT